MNMPTQDTTPTTDDADDTDDEQPDTERVYRTDHAEAYHVRLGCGINSGSELPYLTTVEDAEDDDLEPCSVCLPDGL